MAATTVVIGRVAPRAHSAAMFMRDGANRGTWRQVEPTRTPITQLPDVCDVCGGVGCDCITPQAQLAAVPDYATYYYNFDGWEPVMSFDEWYAATRAPDEPDAPPTVAAIDDEDGDE